MRVFQASGIDLGSDELCDEPLPRRLAHMNELTICVLHTCCANLSRRVARDSGSESPERLFSRVFDNEVLQNKNTCSMTNDVLTYG